MFENSSRRNNHPVLEKNTSFPWNRVYTQAEVPAFAPIPGTPLGTPRAALINKAAKAEKKSPGHGWRDQEVQIIPRNNMWLVFPGLMLMTFLAALDQTVVSIALPTIVEDIGGESGYSWIGTAYMLMAVCVAPLNGKLSNIVGRKPILYASIPTFLIGSALCGAAQNFIWLALSRGIQGLGAGGIMQMTQIIVSDITPLRERPVYDNLIEATYAFASVIGPFVGGALTEHASWRWTFWINIPTGAVAMTILVFFLNLNPPEKRPAKEVMVTFDYIGLFLLTGGVSLFLVGFQEAQTAKKGWASAETIGPLVAGILFLGLAIINELKTEKEPIIPIRVFKTLTTTGIMIGGFVHNLTFLGASYYAPLYFQILGSSPTMAGIKLLPFSFISAVVSIGVGLIITKKGQFRPFLWAGFAIMTFGYGLMIMMDERTGTIKQEVYLLVAGMGIGCLFQPPFVGLNAAVPNKDMAPTLSTLYLMQSVGGTVGISIGDTIFATELAKRLAHISGYDSGSSSELTGFTDLIHIEPESLRNQVLHAYTKSLSVIWIFFCVISFFGLCAVLGVRAYSLDRRVQRDAEDQNPLPDGPEGAGGVVAIRPGDEGAQVTRRPGSEGQQPRSEEDSEEMLIAGPNAYGYAFDSMRSMVTYIYNLFDYLRTLFKDLDG